MKCLTGSGESPVLHQLVLVKLGPGEHEPQLTATESALSRLERVDLDLRGASAWRAWKCGAP